MISHSARMAIRALLYLSSHPAAGDKRSLNEISQGVGANEHSMGKVLQKLSGQGLVHSIKGPGGGFYLDETQKQVPLMHIIEAIDGTHRFEECGLGLPHCSASHPCPLHDSYQKARETMAHLFQIHRVEDLCQPINQGLAHLVGGPIPCS